MAPAPARTAPAFWAEAAPVNWDGYGFTGEPVPDGQPEATTAATGVVGTAGAAQVAELEEEEDEAEPVTAHAAALEDEPVAVTVTVQVSV